MKLTQEQLDTLMPEDMAGTTYESLSEAQQASVDQRAELVYGEPEGANEEAP